MANSGYIIGVGAANLDVMGRSRMPLVAEDSNPGAIGVSVGGVTHNILENLSRMGAATKLVTTVGDDLFGGIVRAACDSAGIDTSGFVVLPGEISSTYMSIHQNTGKMALALSDMSILQKLSAEHLSQRRGLLENASALVIDGGLPEAAIDHLMSELGGRVPIFADPVSTTYARKFTNRLRGLHTIKPNLLEAEVLAEMKIKNDGDLRTAADRILAKGVRRVVISMGAQGVYLMDEHGEARHRPRPIDSVVNDTGAGDSYMAGLLYAYTRGMSTAETLDWAAGASIITLMSKSTISPEMSCKLIKSKIQEYMK